VAAAALGYWLAPGLLNSQPTLEAVRAKLASADPQTRIEGLQTLTSLEMDQEQGVSLLLEVLRKDRSQEVRSAAVNALVNNGVSPERVRAEIKPLLTSEQNAYVKGMLEWLVEQSGQR
jgi:hypothetical protein